MDGATLPTGTVTFLFTDIEGSTQLLHRLGERYGEALADQRAILRDVFEQCDGHEVDTQGDAFFVAFARPGAAVAATVAAQRALAAHPWPAEETLRVRMGLHTGQPQLAPTGYVGVDVHRAARIAHVAHGGQVLLSETAYALVRDELPEEVGLRDLGEHRLKDLQRPQRLYQLVMDGLPADFPPLKSLDAHPHNLPVQPTSLVGREAELAVVRSLILNPEVRLLTLTGPGGVGKTRLGLGVAAEMVEEFQDGVYFISLASITDPGLVMLTIAQTLGLREQGGLAIEDVLQGLLQDQRVLLLLDNFEQVIEAAPQITGLLAACNQLKAVVTSREALRLRGEREFPVPSLKLPDLAHLPSPDVLVLNPAVDLFVQRAGALKPDFELDTANAHAVAEICAHLDGLPLALELAAARVKLMPPVALLKRLVEADGRAALRLLTAGARDAPDRQRTLHATIEWSYRLLKPIEQMFFRSLAVFAGGFTLDAAESICVQNPQISAYLQADFDVDLLGGLASLVDKSLLRQEQGMAEEPRFSMLGTIREYALDLLGANGETESVSQSHALYFLEFAQTAEKYLEKPEQALWLDRLEAERANLRAALAWAIQTGEVELGLKLGIALCLYWFMRGYLSEGREWFERLLALPEVKSDPMLYARALDRAGLIARYHGDYTRAGMLVGESLAIWRQLGNQQGVADALANLGYVNLHQGSYDQARTLYEEALAINRSKANRLGTADALSHLALIDFYRGNLDSASTQDAESLAIWQELGDQQGVAWAQSKLGIVLLHQGNLATAKVLFLKSLQLSHQTGLKWGIANSLEGLACYAALAGEDKRALILAGAAEKLRYTIGTPLSEASQAILDRTLWPARQNLTEYEIKLAWEQADMLELDEVLLFATGEYDLEGVRSR